MASICFKHGPPRLTGVELEWTVHHIEDPAAPLAPARLIDALGAHAPRSLVPATPATPMPSGCLVSVEPGGQVELSAPATGSMPGLLAALSADAARLAERCLAAGLDLGSHAVDPFRPARRILRTPRYAAMETAFERYGPDGATMMCSTAGVQVCVDMGEADRLVTRWAAVHALGPVMCALFGNSAPGSGWVSARQRAVFGSDPVRMRPAAVTADPAADWARRVLDAPVICVRGLGDCWTPPRPMSFTQWLEGALPIRPTVDDLEYHLSTMFPPVRPQGYIELRYVDAQPGQEWLVPVIVLTALLSGDTYTDRLFEATRPAAGRWIPAARHGLADPSVARAAAAVVALCIEAVRYTGLDRSVTDHVIDELHRRLAPCAAA